MLLLPALGLSPASIHTTLWYSRIPVVSLVALSTMIISTSALARDSRKSGEAVSQRVDRPDKPADPTALASTGQVKRFIQELSGASICYFSSPRCCLHSHTTTTEVLLFHKLTISAPALQQLRMRAALHKLAGLQHEYLVCFLDRTEAVCYRNCRSPFGCFV
jgi:hypothetical protein